MQSSEKKSINEGKERYTFFDRVKDLGPAAIITAGVVGTGSVTTMSVAGSDYQYGLMWVLLVNLIMAICILEMAARVGVVAQMSMQEAIRNIVTKPLPKYLLIALVLGAVGIGGTAFGIGNMTGSSMALEIFFSSIQRPVAVGIVAAIVIALIWSGTYKRAEKFLKYTVFIFSAAFLLTAILVRPNIGGVLKGMFVPNIPAGSLVLIIGMLGTGLSIIEPLLLSNAVKERFNGPQDLVKARWDLFIMIPMYVLASMFIIITGASLFGKGITIGHAVDMAKQLEPLLGSWSQYLFALGMGAAAVSSAYGTGGLCVPWAVLGILGYKSDPTDRKFKIIGTVAILFAAYFAAIGVKPVQVIIFAQATNGILAPIAAGILLYLCNSKKLLGDHTNATWQNILGIIIVLFMCYLGVRTIAGILA